MKAYAAVALTLACVMAALFPVTCHAQVKVALVSADTSISPGHTSTLALRMEHEPHWHTYWINAGTGYPTSVKWDLPAGWSVSDIQWPTPMLIRSPQGDVTGNGYDGVLYLPVTLTPPANARPGKVMLRGQARWLMCADICIPGTQSVSLTLPVSHDPPKPNDSVRAELAKMPMPQPAEQGKNAARRAEKNVTLEIDGAAEFKAPHFFSEDGFIQTEKPQSVAHANGKLSLTLPIADNADTGTGKLIGVLAYEDESGAYRGMRIDASLAGEDAAAPAAERTVTSRLMGTLLLALVGGLILNLMPCVFPVLGIKVLGFVNQAGNDRRKVSIHGFAFTAGVLLSFWALAGILAVLRAGGEQLGWGFQLQSPGFVFILAVVMLVFALSLSGVFEFGLSATGVGSNLQTVGNYSGSFFTGILATVVATPCSAPFLAPALGSALALPTAQSFLVFTSIGAGLSLPYLLLSIFPDVVKMLPRPGRWMETFKQLMAFPLYATVALLVWVLAGQLTENGLLSALLGLTVVALAIWIYGRYAGLASTPGRRTFGWVAGLALLIVGVYVGSPRAATPTDIVWEPWSTVRTEQLRAEGRPIYVDFTARWCATCQANKKLIFASDELKKLFRDRNVALLKADWTNGDPKITAELARWNRSAVPFNLIYQPGHLHPTVLPELLTPGIVLDAFVHGPQ